MGRCLDVGDGRSAIAFFDISIDHRWLLNQTQTTMIFSDEKCAVLDSQSVTTRTGMIEEAGNMMRAWGSDPKVEASSDFNVFYIDHPRGERRFTLTRAACLPMPACESDSPEQIVVVPGLIPR